MNCYWNYFGLEYLAVMIFTSWITSLFFEGLIWYGILRYQLGRVRLLAVLGWMGLVQLVSTPLSYGVAILFYGLTQPIIPVFLQYLIGAAVDLTSNPLGVFVGFLVIPVILETGFWYAGLRTGRDGKNQIQEIKWALSNRMLILGVIIANAASFLIGIVLSFLLSTQTGMMFGFYFWAIIWTIFLLIFIFAVVEYERMKMKTPPTFEALTNRGDSL